MTFCSRPFDQGHWPPAQLQRDRSSAEAPQLQPVTRRWRFRRKDLPTRSSHSSEPEQAALYTRASALPQQADPLLRRLRASFAKIRRSQAHADKPATGPVPAILAAANDRMGLVGHSHQTSAQIPSYWPQRKVAVEICLWSRRSEPEYLTQQTNHVARHRRTRVT
jgi:hypothetical protein